MLASRLVRLGLLCTTTAITLTACRGGGESGTTTSDAGQSTPSTAVTPAAGAPQTPEPGRKVVVVEALTDDQGNNVFRPDKFEVHRGDVIRFTLKSGVHNINFLPDSNAGRSGLPTASDMLQLPGQTYDVKVSFAPGHYYFQCDPHAALGMKGHVEVED